MGAITYTASTPTLATIRDLCEEVVWLHEGRLIRQGPTKEVTRAYTKFLDVGADDVVAFEDF